MRGELVNENACALIMCIISKEPISVDTALKKFGVGVLSIAKGVKKEDQHRLKESDMEGIKKLYYEEYYTLPEIAKVYNVSQGTVASFFKRYELQARPKGWGRYNNTKKAQGGKNE